MKVSEVTVSDGKSCALLIKFLNNGRWELSGTDAETLAQTKRWLHDVAVAMAAQLQPAAPVPGAPAPTPPSGGFRVKAMGPLSSKQSRKKK